MADSKRESRGVKLIGLENNADSDWGLYALAANGMKYAISENEYKRLQKERRETGDIPSLDFSQVLFTKTEDGEICCKKSDRAKTSDDMFVYTGEDAGVRITDKREDKTGDLSIKVTADVNDAITGFKALSRELREATKAARELEQAYSDVEKAKDLREGNVIIDGKKVSETIYAIDFGLSTHRDLSEVPTEVLHEELSRRKREGRSEEHTSELQSRGHLVCRLLLEK